MNGNNWVLEKVIFNNFKLLLRKVVPVIMICQTINDIRLLLQHLLQEQEYIHTNIETGSNWADIVIWEAVFTITKFWNFWLVILFTLLDAKVVNLNIDSMSHLKELDNILSIVSDGNIYTCSWITKGYHIIVNISEIKIKTIYFESIFLLTYESSQTNDWV